MLHSQGEGLSASRQSLRRLSYFPPLRRVSRDSRGSIMLNFLQPDSSLSPSVNTTLTFTPPSSCPTSSRVPELLVCGGERDDIPKVVVFPPEEEEESHFSDPAHCRAEGEEAGSAHNILHLTPPSEGKYHPVISMGIVSHGLVLVHSLTLCLALCYSICIYIFLVSIHLFISLCLSAAFYSYLFSPLSPLSRSFCSCSSTLMCLVSLCLFHVYV